LLSSVVFKHQRRDRAVPVSINGASNRDAVILGFFSEPGEIEWVDVFCVTGKVGHGMLEIE
jgi:hypothetical protein